MPFVKVSRDKRGYETISLMHAPTRRGKPSKPRPLYVFRTPPAVKVGREPFDEAVRRELEASHPEIHFDWVKLSNIPVPSPDVEYWRERRRVERAAKQARRESDQAEATVDAEVDDDGVSIPPQEPDVAGADAELADLSKVDDEFEADSLQSDRVADGSLEALSDVQDEGDRSDPTPASPGAGLDGRSDVRRRRRRRGGRKRHRRQHIQGSGALPPEEPEKDPDASKVPEEPSKEA